MHGIQPAVISLIAASMCACLGLSVFTTEIPFIQLIQWTIGKHVIFPDFNIRWSMIPIFITSFYMLYYKKLSIMATILLSGLAGILIAAIILVLKGT